MERLISYILYLIVKSNKKLLLGTFFSSSLRIARTIYICTTHLVTEFQKFQGQLNVINTYYDSVGIIAEIIDQAS